MTFQNPTDKVMEGELVFPLPDGGIISGYGLDVDGVLVPGGMTEISSTYFQSLSTKCKAELLLKQLEAQIAAEWLNKQLAMYTRQESILCLRSMLQFSLLKHLGGSAPLKLSSANN